MVKFLTKHSSPANIALFKDISDRLAESSGQQPGGMGVFVQDVVVLAPAFILTELTEAFQIGFIIFLPFLVIDLVVSNVLLSLGMQMMQTTTVSMPLKLLLFVLIDGWRLIMQGLSLGYLQ
jgi:type III secretion protein R